MALPCSEVPGAYALIDLEGDKEMGTCDPHIFPPGSPGLLPWAWTGAWEGTTSIPHPNQQGHSLSTSMRRKKSGLQKAPLTLGHVARILYKGPFEGPL